MTGTGTGGGSGDGSDADDPRPGVGRRIAGWPVALRGVTESVIATLGPNDRWNLAALGLHAPRGDGATTGDGPGREDAPGDAVTAVTWGNTRTRRNVGRQGGGRVQFSPDPRLFVDAALSIKERDEPVHPSADAWVSVETERVATGESGGTTWRRFRLDPVESGVRGRRVPTFNRGYAAVVDATVAASRLSVPTYDEDDLRERLRYFAGVVETAGGPAEREAFARIDDHVGWRADEP